jgi:hypothetical protein
LTAKRSLESGQLGLNIYFDASTLDDVLAIAAEEIIDGLDSNADGAGGFIFIEV